MSQFQEKAAKLFFKNNNRKYKDQLDQKKWTELCYDLMKETSSYGLKKLSQENELS